MTRLGDLLDEAARLLGANGTESPRMDATFLLGYAARLTREQMLAHPDQVVPPIAEQMLHTLLERRLRHEPMAYILGRREFYGRLFKTDHRALIPRPETESLVEVGISAVRAWRHVGVEPRVVDVGTGSGAVALSVAAEACVPVVATDVSAPALELARENALALGMESRVQLRESDLLEGVDAPVHVLLANLPYLPAARVLPPDVSHWEPIGALRSGPEGTDHNERLLRTARPLLAPGATLAIEMDEGQGPRLSAVASALYPGAHLAVCRDAAKLERLLVLRLSALGERCPGEA